MHCSRYAVPLVAVGVLFTALGAAWGGQQPQLVSVSRTFDDHPFQYRMELRRETDGFRVYRLTYPSPVLTPFEQNNVIPADYYLPTDVKPGGPKRPAVICLHILNGNFELVHMTCSMLASHGVPAIMFKLPYYGERSLPEGRKALLDNPKIFVESLPQGIRDVQRTIDVLASRPEIDADRIGVTGISLGGILAATAAGTDPRISRAALVLAGGDLPYVIEHAREVREVSDFITLLPPKQKDEIERAIRSVDPLEHTARLRELAGRKKVLMVNAAEDHVVPRQCTQKLASALGMEDRVVWLEGLGHYTAMAALPEVMQTIARFFAEDLPPELRESRPASPSRQPLHVLASLIGQATALLSTEPADGRCHLADLEVTATDKDGKVIRARLRFVRGSKQRFKLRCKLPVVGEISIGQSGRPWMASGEKVVFRGGEGSDVECDNPLVFADKQHLLKLQMVCGAAAGIALVPDMLSQWITAEDDTAEDGNPAVRIVSNAKKVQGTVLLVLKENTATPLSLSFDSGGVTGTVKFHGWQINTIAHDALFEEPAGLTCQEVDRTDLYRIFSAMFDFAMEKAR